MYEKVIMHPTNIGPGHLSNTTTVVLCFVFWLHLPEWISDNGWIMMDGDYYINAERCCLSDSKINQ